MLDFSELDLDFGDDDPEEEEPEPTPVADDNVKYVPVPPVLFNDPVAGAHKKIAKMEAEKDRLHALALEAAEGVEKLSPGEPQVLAANALAARIRQREAELQLRIDDLTVAAPFIDIPDLGSYEVAKEIRDPDTGLVLEALRDEDTGEKIYPTGFKTADGHIGQLVRELEDATAAYRKVAQDYPKQSLRAQDAFAELAEAKDRVEAATAETERRQRDEHRNERVTERAAELANEAVRTADAVTRAEIEADTSLGAEARAVALAKLDVPLSERTTAKQQWDAVWDAAVEQARGEERATLLGSAMGKQSMMVGPDGQPMLFDAQDAVYHFLVAGEPAEREDLAALAVVDEGAIPALEWLGAISGEDAKRWTDEQPTVSDKQARLNAQLGEARRETAARHQARAKARIEQARPKSGARR